MKESIVSRTIVRTVAHGLIVDIETRTVKDWTDTVPNTCDTTDKALAYVRKTVPAVVAINSVEKTEKLVGMTESEFIAHAYWHGSERTKATRYAVTKEITTKEVTLLAVNADRKVVEVKALNVDTEKSARKHCETLGLIFVQIIGTVEKKEIYAVTEVDFETYAHPMKNRFSLA